MGHKTTSDELFHIRSNPQSHLRMERMMTTLLLTIGNAKTQEEMLTTAVQEQMLTNTNLYSLTIGGQVVPRI